MSTHHIDCAAQVDLPPSKKLVLLCLADGADKFTRKVAPGLDNVMTWAGLKKSRALEVIAELIADGYLVRTSPGRIGHMAEFVIFPQGCCALHGPLDEEGPAQRTLSAVEGPAQRTLPDAGGSDRGSDRGSDSYRTPPVSPVTTKNSLSSTDDPFTAFWAAYPRKVAKPAAHRAYKAATKNTNPETILEGLARFRFSDDEKFRPHPATWLNQRRWEDAPAEKPKSRPYRFGDPVGW